MEKTIGTEHKFSGKIIDIRHDKVQFDKGKTSVREVATHPGGVVIIPVLDNGDIVLIKQWRYPLGQELIEFPAGKLDTKQGTKEHPLEAAKREIVEEIGYTAKKWTDLGYIYTTPGFCDEKLYFYKAEELEFVGAKPEEGEFIEPFSVSSAKIKAMIKNNEIKDAKTIAGVVLAL